MKVLFEFENLGTERNRNQQSNIRKEGWETQIAPNRFDKYSLRYRCSLHKVWRPNPLGSNHTSVQFGLWRWQKVQHRIRRYWEVGEGQERSMELLSNGREVDSQFQSWTLSLRHAQKIHPPLPPASKTSLWVAKFKAMKAWDQRKGEGAGWDVNMRGSDPCETLKRSTYHVLDRVGIVGSVLWELHWANWKITIIAVERKWSERGRWDTIRIQFDFESRTNLQVVSIWTCKNRTDDREREGQPQHPLLSVCHHSSYSPLEAISPAIEG